MKNLKRETVDVSKQTRKTARPPKAASFGVLALCIAAMGFVVKKGMELDKQEAEEKAAQENKTEE